MKERTTERKEKKRTRRKEGEMKMKRRGKSGKENMEIQNKKDIKHEWRNRRRRRK